MGNERGCIYCRYSDKNRKQGEKIRCKRLSKWVAPRGEACEEYRVEFSLSREPLSSFVTADMILDAAGRPKK